MLVIVFIVNAFGCKALNRLGKQMGIIGAFHFFGNFGLRSLSGMDNQRTTFDQRPFHSFFRAVNLKALAVLPGCIEQGAVNMGAQIGVYELDVGRSEEHTSELPSQMRISYAV